MKSKKQNTKRVNKRIRNSNYNFLLELSDEELDKLAGGEIEFNNLKNGFSQRF